MTTLIVTGSRDWTDGATIEKVVIKLLNEFGTDIHVVHGAARGVDKHFAWFAKKHGVAPENIHDYPADWKRYHLAAGPIRNREMLDAFPNAELVVAFPLLTSIGTYDMINEAKSRGYKIRIYDPVGEYRYS